MLTEEDPILRAFELSSDLKELSLVEVEFRYVIKQVHLISLHIKTQAYIYKLGTRTTDICTFVKTVIL